MLSDSSKHQQHLSERADVPKGTTRRITWGPLSAVLVVLGAFVGSQAVGSVLISLYTQLRRWSPAETDSWLTSVPAQFSYVLISEICIVVVIWLFLRHRGVRFGDIGFKRPHWIDPLLMVAGAIGYFALYIATISVLSATVGIDVEQQQEIGFNDVVGDNALVLTFISLVILPPLVEELTFRGFLYTGLRKKLGFWGATIGTSLLFAMPHLMQSGDQKLLWIAGVDTLVLSLVLCYLREKTGRLWASIGVHAIKNGVAFVSLFILHAR